MQLNFRILFVSPSFENKKLTSIIFIGQLLQMGCDIIIGTPGRFLQIIKQGSLSLNNIKYAILDEADKLLLDNPSDIDQILGHNTMPLGQKKSVLMFSATMPKKSTAERYLHEYIFLYEQDNMGGACRHIIQDIHEKYPNEKNEKLIECLKSSDAIGTIIFANNKTQVENVSDVLLKSNISCRTLDGDMSTENRQKCLNDFKKGIVSILVATDVASRGLGKDNLNKSLTLVYRRNNAQGIP